MTKFSKVTIFLPKRHPHTHTMADTAAAPGGDAAAQLSAVGCALKGRKIECKGNFGSELKVNSGNFRTRGQSTDVSNLRQFSFTMQK